MPFARLDFSLEMYYEDDDFTDPWRTPETVVLHHGNAKNSQLWYGWVPLLARSFRVGATGCPGFRPVDRAAGRLPLVSERFRSRSAWSPRPPGTGKSSPDWRDRRRDHLPAVCLAVPGQAPVGDPPAPHPTSFVGSADVPRVLQPWCGDEGVEGLGSGPRPERRLESGDADSAHQEWYINQMAQTPARVVMETLDYLSGQDLTDTLQKIRTPALILASEQNASANPDRTTGMVSLLPNGRLKVIPGTSGYVQHSAPEQCVQTWRQFVNSL